MIIVSTLAVLNLEHVVFKIMAGLTEGEKSANDAAYGILWLITTFSIMSSPVLIVSYLAIIYSKWKKPVTSR